MSSAHPRTLGFAVWSENLQLVQELLEDGVPVDDYGAESSGVTPLMESVDETETFYDADRAAVTELLLAHGADVTRQDLHDRTALHFAAGAGGAAVGLLLRAGAEIGARDEDGATPLHVAIRRGCVTAVVALCQAGADPKAADNRGESPIDVLSATTSEFDIAELEELRSALSA